MEAQTVFNIAVQFIVRQNLPSVGTLGPMYRDGRGCKCIIGCLLTDDEYSYDFEGNTVDGLPLPDRLAEHRGLLQAMQTDYDVSVVVKPTEEIDWSLLELKLCQIARKYNLIVPCAVGLRVDAEEKEQDEYEVYLSGLDIL